MLPVKAPSSFDHIKHGEGLIHYLIPPKFPTNEEVGIMKDGLVEIIPGKLKLLLSRSKELQKIKNEKLETIEQSTDKRSVDRWFWSSFVFHQFEEYYVIQKWLNYWLKIWYRATDKELPRKIQKGLNKVDESEIEQAKQNPFQYLCEDPVLKAGRYTKTNCPFHADKTPSFFIYPDNTAHCFGCQWHGDTIKFYMETRNVSFPDAVRALI